MIRLKRFFCKCTAFVCAKFPQVSEFLNQRFIRDLNDAWKKHGELQYNGIKVVYWPKMARTVADILHSSEKERKSIYNSMVVYPIVEGQAHFFILTGIHPDEMHLPEARVILEHEWSHIVEFQYSTVLDDATALDWELLADNRAALSVGLKNYYNTLKKCFEDCPGIGEHKDNQIRLQFLEYLMQ